MEIVKKTLSLEEVIKFTEEVVSDFFDYNNEGEIISYVPYLGKLKMKLSFLKYYTDYEFSDTEKDYQYVSIFVPEDYFDKINFLQYLEMRDSIINEVKVRKQIYINSQNGLNKLLNTITSLVSKFDVNSMNEFMEKYGKSDLSAQGIVDAYLKSEHYQNDKEKELNEIIDAKNEIIENMKKQK